MVKETEEEGEEEEEELEYMTDTPLGGLYMTPPSTGGHSSPSLAPSHSSTLGDSNPENNVALHTEELEACIEAFLEEAEEDLEMNDLPLLKNTSPLLVPAPVFSGFVPFAISTGQHCVPLKSLLRKVYHPYKDPVGRCHCEPGGWCDNLPCSSWKQCVLRKIRGHSLSHGSGQSGRCASYSRGPSDEGKSRGESSRWGGLGLPWSRGFGVVE